MNLGAGTLEEFMADAAEVFKMPDEPLGWIETPKWFNKIMAEYRTMVARQLADLHRLRRINELLRGRGSKP